MNHWPLKTIVIATFTALLADASGFLQPIDWLVGDFRTRLLQRSLVSDAVVIEIDAYSLRQMGSWPWPRGHHALLLQHLRDAGASTVFFDIDFSSPSRSDEDRRFAESLANATPTRVILPVFRQPSRFAQQDSVMTTQPLPMFGEHSELVTVNVWQDNDGLLRRVPLGLDSPIGFLPTFAALLQPPTHQTTEPASLYLDFTILPTSFKHLSYFDVLSGNFSSADISGRPVIVGATALELGDLIPVPVYHLLPGPVLQALAYQSLRAGSLRPLPSWLLWTLTLVLTALVGVIMKHSTWRVGVVTLMGLGVALFAGSLILYSQHRVVFDMAGVLLSLTLCILLVIFNTLDRQQLKLWLQRLDLRRKDALVQNIVDNSIDGIITFNAGGKITLVNPAAEQIFGYAAGEMLGLDSQTLVANLTESTCTELRQRSVRQLFESTATRRDGSTFPVEVALSKLNLDEQTSYTVFLRDITERKSQQLALHYQASYDVLTGLLNRATLLKKLDELTLNAAPGQDLQPAFLMLDLDRFKDLNDAFGHEAGDRLLYEVGNRLVRATGPDAILARIGGDEFAVLVQNAYDRSLVCALAERLLTSTTRAFHVNGVIVELGLSIGIAFYPEHGQLSSTLMQRASLAMYKAKHMHLGYVVYDNDFDPNSLRRVSMTSSLRAAISSDRLQLHYQPKLNLTSHRVSSAEALLRWHDPVLGAISPEEFIRLAEDNNLIKPLTQWVLETALDHCSLWRERGEACSIAINLSAQLLQDAAFIKSLGKILTHYPIAMGWLEIEITETALIGDLAQAVRSLDELHQLGIPLAIDDFGTGYSSMSYLRDLPVQFLKVDKSFVLDMVNYENNRAIVKATIDLAHNLGLKAIAEGVEDPATMALLKTMGCDYTQGFGISRPLPKESFERWLRDWNRERSAPAKRDIPPEGRKPLLT